MKKIAFLLILTAFSFSITAQAEDFFLDENDNLIAFVGDSITQWKRYDALVEAYIVTRFPDRDIRFRNLGRSGDTSWFVKRGGVENGFNRDILPLNPSVVFINLGVNDTHYGLDKVLCTEQSLCDLITRCKKIDSKVVLLSPSSFDGKEENQLAGNAKNNILKEYVKSIEKAAEKTDTKYIDQFHPYLNTIEKARNNGHKNYLLNRDTTHPEWRGHIVMAWIILKGLNAPADVSNVEIDAASAKLINHCGCDVTQLKKNGDTISFVRKDDTLPWPVPTDVESVMKVSDNDILGDLSRYMLKINGLKSDLKYKIIIDGEKCATYKGSELADGVNLTMHAGPITQQCRAILSLISQEKYIYYVRWQQIQIEDLPKGYKFEEQVRQKNAILKKLDEAIENAEKAIKKFSKTEPHKFMIAPDK